MTKRPENVKCENCVFWFAGSSVDGEGGALLPGKQAVNVGDLRTQSAYADCLEPVVLVSSDPEVRRLIRGLRVESVYPDTTDADGAFIPTFKIKVEPIEGGA